MYISTSNHCESYLSGSTTKSFIKRAKELGVSHFAVTDVGSLISIMKSYALCKDAGIKLIPGIELLFKDPNCPIAKGSNLESAKYFRILVHFRDQKSYQTMVKMVSDSNRPKVLLRKEFELPVFNWSDLEEISKLNVTVSTAGIEDLVLKTFTMGHKEKAEQYFDKLLNLFGNRYYPAVISHNFTHYPDDMVKIHFINGHTIEIPASTKIKTESNYPGTKAIDLVTHPFKNKQLFELYLGGLKSKVKETYRYISKAEVKKSFVEIGKNLTAEANIFLLDICSKRPVDGRILVNDNAYYANSTDHIIQDMKIGEDGSAIHEDMYMRSQDEAYANLSEIHDNPEIFFANTLEWAKLFDDFSLKYDYRLVDCGEDVEKQLITQIKKLGRMKWDDPRYVRQFREEFELLTKNGVLNLIPYFLPLIKIMDYYRENGYLVGPSRGSSAGFLISYLCGITQIDPIVYGLSSARFLTIDRIQQGNLPDIDCLSADTMISTLWGDISVKTLSEMSPEFYPQLLCKDEDCIFRTITETPSAVYEKGIGEMFEFTLDDGKTLKCTEGHKVLTLEGWVAISEAMERELDILTI